ncbi:MAG: CotH kinase family protein [Treponema sp.]|nr:CotH kinase family protein [Treponema sp.]
MNRLWEICYEAVYNKQYYKFNSSFELEEWTDIPGANDNEKCKNCVQAVIDLGSLADTYVFNELVCDPDLYYSSFYMSLDFAEGKERKLTFSAPWDFDSTMGNKSFCIADTSNEDSSKKYIRHINEMHAGRGQANVNCEDGFVHGNPWMMIFVNQAWFQDMVKASWAGVKAKNVLPELVQFIDARSTDALQVAYNATRDNELWRDADEGWKWELCTASKNAEAVSQKASADYLKEWLTARFTAVDSIITNMTPHSF